MARSTYATAATSLGDEMLMLLSLSGHEALCRPFVYTLDLLSHDEKIDFKSVLNQPVQVQIELKDGQRYIHGICSHFGRIGETGRHSLYRAVLRPWLWSLTRSSDCRIFPDMTIPEVIKKVFQDHGFSDFDMKLTRDYQKFEYLAQYRETAFSFVQRLMEQEGIYYFFEHSKSKHQLVMTDSSAEQCTLPGYEEIPYFPPNATEQRERDHIDSWRVMQEVQTSQVTINDYDFKAPKADLIARSKIKPDPKEFELYDYPGEYVTADDGNSYARVWKEQLDAAFETIEGQGNARGLVVGAQFKLKNYTRKDQDRNYQVTEARYSLDTGWAESGPRTTPPTYRCSFNAQPTDVPFRPARSTPKPSIAGPQTAVVVAYDKKKEEIHTDEFGRIRVRFHWVRPDAEHKETCFVRVAQAWAGSGFGGLFIPRVGHEVVVEFLEGDPDRPLVTGSVYNANNKPPFGPPGHKTQSGFKTRSSKDGGEDNFNEICFEDLKGSESLRMQAEKDLKLTVKNDSTGRVGHDHKHTVKNDLTLEVTEGNYETKVSQGHMQTRVPSDLYGVDAKEIKLVVGASNIHMDEMGITLTAYGSKIEMTAAGISVNGTFIKLNG